MDIGDSREDEMRTLGVVAATWFSLLMFADSAWWIRQIVTESSDMLLINVGFASLTLCGGICLAIGARLIYRRVL